MSSTTVKCNSCNVVISELLAFVQNKIDVMDEESLVRICATAFSVEEVSNAKKLLFESAPSTKRKVNRRGSGKSERDLYDIITLLKETDPEKVPIFVARELQKLPPVTFDHVDATRLLKDIILIQRELKIAKETFITKEDFCTVKDEIENLKSSYNVNNSNSNAISKVNKNLNLNFNRHNCFQPDLPQTVENTTIDNSVDIFLSPLRQPTECNDVSLEHFVDACATGTRVEASTAVTNNISAAGIQVREVCDAVGLSDTRKVASGRDTYANAVSKPRQIKIMSMSDVNKQDTDQGEGWILAQKKKKLKDRFIGTRGRATIDLKFRAADIKIPLFISNVDKSVSESDIHSYIMSKTQSHVDIEKIVMKKPKEYDAYKILVPRYKLHLYLDDNLWPEGISFRKYIDFKKRAYKNTHNGSQQYTEQK